MKRQTQTQNKELSSLEKINNQSQAYKNNGKENKMETNKQTDECVECGSEKQVLDLMKGLACGECGKAYFSNTKEEQKVINRLFKGSK